ncbi:MAG: cupin domain-containing protein [Desulfamplus sp.]|nr:cupin domain-containing protein [Desulfamplus sp.]
MFGLNSTNGYTEVLNGIRIKTINFGKQTLMTEFVLTKDALLVEHAHIYEQTGYLVKGKIKLYINGVSQIINPGDSWNIPSNIKHKAEILEDSIAIEVFCPFREDYEKFINKDDIIE